MKSFKPKFRAPMLKIHSMALKCAAKSAFEIDVIIFRYAKSAFLTVGVVLIVSQFFGFSPFLNNLIDRSLHLTLLVATSCVISLIIAMLGVLLLKVVVCLTYPELDAIGSDEELIEFFKPLNERQKAYIRAIAKCERARLKLP